MSDERPGLGPANGLLLEAVQRAPLFAALREEPHTASDLEHELELSRSTIHRATQSLTEEGLLRKSDDAFELTGFGRVVADRIAGVRTSLDAARRLEPFLNTVDSVDFSVPVGLFADAEVTSPQSRQPHFGVKRIVECIEATGSLRMFSSVISPFYVEVAHREILDGTEIEVVFDTRIIDIIAERYAERAAEAARTGRFDVYVHDGIPFELFLFDDRIGMAAHDDEGIARAFVETDDGEAIEWAEDVYEEYRSAADPVDHLDRSASAPEQR